MEIPSILEKKQAHSAGRAKPFTLEEVLRLRDGVVPPKPSGSSFPYPFKIIACNEKILLALN
jgi:hypothetical protein